MLGLQMIIYVSVKKELEMGNFGAERVVDNTRSANHITSFRIQSVRQCEKSTTLNAVLSLLV